MTMTAMDLTGSVVLLTGASSGIGEAVAESLAARGASLAICARRTEKLEDLATRLGDNVLPLACDVSDLASVRHAVAATVARFGRLDHLVNNAGVIEPIGLVHETDPAEWADALRINLLGAYHTCHVALPHLLERGGTIVNISSGAAHRPLEGWSGYCAGKAGLAMLTQSLMLEYGERGLRVFGFAPGMVRTGMQVKIKAAGLSPVSRVDHATMFPPQAPARIIAYLCSPASADVAQGACSINDDAFAEFPKT
jgi:NAD(P)-dependent dehydrogenase (short-subunit alcohol dehydrogenase family)